MRSRKANIKLNLSLNTQDYRVTQCMHGCTQSNLTEGQTVTYLCKDSITESLSCRCLSSFWEATVEVGSAHSSQRLHAARPISSWVVCLSPSDDEMLCWEAAQFIKHTVVSGLLSLQALTASQCLFTSRKYDRLYVYLTVCLCECACVEVTEAVASLCVWECVCLRFKVLNVQGSGTVTPAQYMQFKIKTPQLA